MTSGQKIAFSLLTAMLLFAGFVLTLNSTLFDQLETRFYTQSKIQETTEQLNELSESCDSYITDILSLIEKGDSAWVKQASVRSYYVQNPSESDVNERRRLTEQLFNQIPSLKGIRIVDKNGRNVHYSSFDDTDILKVSGITKVYKNYPDIQKDADELPFELLEKKCNSNKATILLDEAKNRLILYVPFNWIDGINSGLCLFYFNIFDIQQDLINSNKLSLGQNITMYAQDDLEGGFVFGIPSANKKEFKAPVEKYWKNTTAVTNAQSPEKLLQMEDGNFWVILTSTRHSTVKVSGIYNSAIFELSKEIKILIYVCIFITVLLFIFLLFSFNRDPVVTLKKRIKKLQFLILENYIDSKEKGEWSAVAGQLRLRKKDLTEEIIKSLNVHSKKRKKELNEYLDKNWEDIFAIFDTKVKAAEVEAPKIAAVTGTAELNGASIEEIRRVMEEVLASHNFTFASASKKSPQIVEPVEDVEELAEDVEEIEEVEELAEDVEEIEDVEELAEDVEEIEDVEELAEDVEEIEDVEELAEDVEEIEEVEELAEDVEDVEEIEEVEELAEDVEELEEEPFESVPASDFSIPVGIMAPVLHDYKESNETYFATDDFPTVENLYAEELCLGCEYTAMNGIETGLEDFEVFIPLQYPVSEEYTAEEVAAPVIEPVEAPVEEPPVKEEEIPELSEAYYTMTSFGANYSGELQELEPEEDSDSVIVEENGVYSITENIDCSNTKQDPDFKALVDSIL